MIEPILELNAASVQALADRLYSLGVSSVATIGPKERTDAINASRALRRLLVAYERASGRELNTILISGVA